jgi:hypothetical protein
MPLSRSALFACCAAVALACESEPTFSDDVAPILQARCQRCHRPGQIAPMPLLSYADARPVAPAIRFAVSSGRMPPFHAAGPIGYWKDDMRLTPRQKQTLLDWVDAGAPEGDPADLPPPIAWNDSPWPLGQPDLVLHFPAHAAAPIYRDEWVTLFSDQAFPHELWARAVQVRTRSTRAVHHATLSLAPPGTVVPPEGKTFDDVTSAVGGLYTWFPGMEFDPLPAGQAIRLPAGDRMLARAHFAPTRKPESEQLEVGIYFANGLVEKVQKRVAIQFIRRLVIPPGDPDFTLAGRREFPESGVITHFRAHMHVRGKSSRILLRYPDGREETVFDLPRYNFNWQRYYHLARPLHVPKGTVALFEGVWDNSVLNPYNPDPTAWCRWGQRTSDEMFGATIFYTPDASLPVPIRVENGRAVPPAV